MAFFGLFRKKSREQHPLVPALDESARPLVDLGNRADFMGAQPDMLLSPQMQNENILSKDVQLITSKIDLVNARLENINKRLESLERFIYSQNQPQKNESQIDTEFRRRW